MKLKILFTFIALIVNHVLAAGLARVLRNNGIAATTASFDKPFYKATYTVNEDAVIDVIDIDEDITIISDSEVNAKLSGDDAFHFDIDCVSGKCQLSVNQNLPTSILTTETEIVLTLEAYAEEDVVLASTLIIINLQSKDIQAPKFTQTYYIYKYQVDDKEKPSLTPAEDPIDVTSDDKESVTIALSDYADNFAIKYDSDADQWNVAITEKLEDSVLSKNTELIIGLTDVLGDSEEGTATLLIELPRKAAADVSFDKTFYEATYTATQGEIDSIEVDGDITISDKEAQVTLTGDYAYHFDVNCSSGNCQIIVIDDLSEALLTKEKEIIIGLEASREETTERSIALVVIHLPLDNVKPAPKFSQTYYLYEYQNDGEKGSLSAVEDPVAITSDDNKSVIVTLSDYHDNFDVTYDSEAEQWNIDVKQPLDETVLKKNTELVVSLTGQLDDSEKGTATLLIKLPEKSSANVTFDNQFYKATYTVVADEVDVIITETEIVISDSEATVTLIGEYAGHFSIDCLSSPCQLIVEDNLSEYTLSNNEEILLGLQVTKEGITEPVNSSVVVILPSGNIKLGPTFSHTYYIYEYQIDGEEISLNPDGDPVAFTSDDSASTKLTLDDYADNFAVAYDSEADQWIIGVKEPLDGTVLEENNELLISLTAELEDSEKSTATLLIKLPEKSSGGVIFDKSFYKAIYIVEAGEIDVVTTEEEIAISDSEATVALTGDYAAHFNIDCSTGTCQLTVEDNLSEYILSNTKEIVLGLQVTKEGITEPVNNFVLVTLPSGNIKLGPKFSHTYYVYQYQIDDEKISLNTDGDPVSFTGDNSASVKLMLDDYEDNFAITYNSKSDQWSIDVIEPLDDTVLNENTELLVSLTAELEDSEKSTATLLIKLPEKSSGDVTFDKSFYRAIYTAQVDQLDVITTEEEILISDSEATVALTGEYAAHFSIECSNGTCQLTVEDNLSENTLSNIKEILLGLEVTKDDIIEPVTSFVLLTLPSGNIKLGPTFSHTYYIYEYQIDGEEVYLNADGDPVAFTSDNSASANVRLNDYQDNFEVIYDSEAELWSIVVKELLNDTVLKENTELLVSLTAQLENSEKSTATLLIKLPEKSSEDVTFSKSFYTGNYIARDEQPDEITIDDQIAISDSEATVTLTGDYASYFDVNCSTGQCELIVKDDFDENILANTSEIIIQIEASTEDIDKPITAIVIIHLPQQNDQPRPKFSQTFYIYDYQVDDQGTPSLTTNGDPISIANADNTKVDISITDYQDYFVLVNDDETNQWNITIQKPLDDSILEEIIALVTSLTAILEDSDEVGTATLIIKFPETNIEQLIQ